MHQHAYLKTITFMLNKTFCS